MTRDWLRVLHVEDDPDIRMIVGLSLALDHRTETRSTGSGAQAIALLGDGAWRPDLLLLDMMMPDMDGTGLAMRIRAIAGLEAVPVVFLTARAQPGDQAGYRGAGSIGLIVKPFDPLTLAARLRGMMPDPA